MSVDIVEAVDEARHDLGLQKVELGEARGRAFASQAKQIPVENVDFGARTHTSNMFVQHGPAKAEMVMGDKMRLLASVKEWPRPALQAFVDGVWPPQCPSCGARVEQSALLCAQCWSEIHFISDPLCGQCGLPFDHDMGEDALCLRCQAHPPAYRRARAAFRYDDHSRGLVLGLKHGDRLESAIPLADWMMRAGGCLLNEADLIVPVPLHRSRLFARRFNQSALLAQRLSEMTKVPYGPSVLRRVRSTPSQGSLTRRQRILNVQGAFSVTPRSRALIENRRVLLIDDVLTTGATAESCARALTRSGASDVDVLSVARVVQAGQLPI